MEKTIGYLGSEGSYSHEVALHLGPSCNLLPLGPEEFVDALTNKRIQQAVLPVVNAIGGQVDWVLDLLMKINGNFGITQEIIWNIRSHLIGFGKPGEINTVYSHNQPLRQCKQFLSRMKGVKTVKTESTSEAVKLVAERKDFTLAAIGTEGAASIYGVPIIRMNVSDHGENQTRFLALGGRRVASTGKDKTTLLFGTKNEPGALFHVLGVFFYAGINMSDLFRIPSLRKRLGECFFIVDVEAHKSDRRMIVALEQIRTKVEHLKVLGSYPVATNPANGR